MHRHENEYHDNNKDKEAMIKEYETFSFSQSYIVKYVSFVAAAQSEMNFKMQQSWKASNVQLGRCES